MTVTVEIKQNETLICERTFNVSSRQELKDEVMDYMTIHHNDILKYTYFIKAVN